MKFYQSGIFLGVFRLAKDMKFLIKGEIRCTVCILYILGIFVLYARALIGQTDGRFTVQQFFRITSMFFTFVRRSEASRLLCCWLGLQVR